MTTKVPFNQLKTQAAKDKRIKENHARQLKIATDAGLVNPQVLHGYIRAFKAVGEMTASTGRPGKHYFLSLYSTDEAGQGQVTALDIYTYAPGLIKRYDEMEALKAVDRDTKTRKLSGTVIFGHNPQAKNPDSLQAAAVFLDQKK